MSRSQAALAFRISAGPPSVPHGPGTRAVIDKTDMREALLLPLVLVTAFLFALGLLTGWHAKDTG